LLQVIFELHQLGSCSNADQFAATGATADQSCCKSVGGRPLLQVDHLLHQKAWLSKRALGVPCLSVQRIFDARSDRSVQFIRLVRAKAREINSYLEMDCQNDTELY
jgi:hypothetical protein